MRLRIEGYRALAGVMVAGSLLRAVAGAAEPLHWQQLEPGLELAAAPAPPEASDKESFIQILRIDPAHFAFVLLNSSASPDAGSRTARAWADGHDLVAVINASMYQTDGRTSTSLMKNGGHANNPRLSKHNAVMLFDRLNDAVPAVQIVDRTCRDLAPLQSQYGAMVQNIRMVSCAGKNVWSQQPHQKWSTAAIGMDARGRVLFIHARVPLTTHDLIETLLALPLELRETMYVEGGPEAQLYVRSGGRELEVVGSQGSSFAGIENTYALPIPNVVGVRRLGAPPAAAGSPSR